MKVNRKTQTFTWDHSPGEDKYYTTKQLKEWKPILDQAEAMWERLCIEYGKDEGSCIIGDHIMAYVLPPRCRNPRRCIIVPAPGVQGGITKEKTVGPVLEFLKSHGIECWHHFGRMD